MERLPSLTLFQMIKAVIFPAVAFACITPMVRLRQIGIARGGSGLNLVTIAMFEGFIVPLAWIALSILLIRRGPWRDGLILVLLLASLSVPQGLACWALARETIPRVRGSGDRDAWISLAVNGLIVLALAVAMGFLVRRLWRMRRDHGPVERNPDPTKVPA